MRKLVLLLYVSIVLNGNVSGQADIFNQIGSEVAKIDKDTTLSRITEDAEVIYKQAFDGGGYLTVWHRGSEIRKIEQQIGLSYGRLTTTLYLQDSIPIYITEKEENFQREQDSIQYGGPLIVVYEVKLFILDWSNDRSGKVETGTRIISEGTCSSYEYEQMMEEAMNLIKRKTE